MATKKNTSNLKRNVVPDSVDLRDRPSLPAVGIIPGTSLDPVIDLPVLDQGSTNACTGFALARVQVSWDVHRGRQWKLNDVLSGQTCVRSGGEMRDGALYVDLKPWQCHLFQVRTG
jgi:hypothetical protein